MDAVLDHAPCGYLLVGDDGVVRDANATLLMMLGAVRGEIIGAHVDRLLGPPSRIFYQTHVFPTLKLQGTVHEIYISIRAVKGEDVPVLLNARRRPAEDGFASDWVVLPMRQRNEYENEILKARKTAEEASRAKEEFLAIVSHELRSPLSGIMGWAQLLQMGNLDAASQERAVRAIMRGTRMQSKIVDDILDFARIFAGKLRLEVQALDLVHVVEDALDSIVPAAEAKGLSVKRNLDANVGLVTGDRDRLQQVLVNILTNAVKFTPGGGEIEVSLERAGPSAELRIRDTGIGIAPDFLPLVFERFRQATDNPARYGGGLGLGMSLASHLIELHGGTIAVASPGAGKGTTFTLRLPLRPSGAPAPTPYRSGQEGSALAQVPMPEEHSLAGLRLLVVEDEPESRELLQTILQDYGADVRPANNVTEALREYSAQRPDLVVSDIEMEGGDGYALVRRIREIEAHKGILTPAIALTGHSRAADRIRALAAGFQMHIPKPVHPAELVAAVANMAALPRGGKQPA
ncbi:MAG TPA: ATP-binding protein [Usitatibacter sp.]|nr:ATP-binding protein [Usitatibacter sp.]